MLVILGLVLLVAAAVVAVAGILGNTGSAHQLTDPFAVFGHHMTGSTGMLFLWGVVVGAVGMLGLALLLAGVRRGATARRGPRHSRRAAADARERRDALAEERAHAEERARDEGRVRDEERARADAESAEGRREKRRGERREAYRQEFARQREALAKEPDHAREQTAGTRTGPMPQDGPEPGSADGSRQSHLL